MTKRRPLQKINILAGLLIVLFLVSCSEKDPAADYPLINLQDESQTRTSTESVLRFSIYLSKPSSEEVSVDYLLKDGTALAGKDYAAASGTIKIAANETQSLISVTIKGDATALRQPNLQFTIELNNPKLCTIGTGTATGTIVTEDGAYLPTDNTGYSTPLTYPGYTLAWSDEFRLST